MSIIQLTNWNKPIKECYCWVKGNDFTWKIAMYQNGFFFEVETYTMDTQLIRILNITHYKIIPKPRG